MPFCSAGTHQKRLTIRHVNIEMAAGLAGLVGLIGGFATGLAIRVSETAQGRRNPDPAPAPARRRRQDGRVQTDHFVRFETVTDVERTDTGLRARVHGERLRIDVCRADVVRVQRALNAATSSVSAASFRT